VPLLSEPGSLEQIGRFLLGLADLLLLVVEKLKQFGAHLIGLAPTEQPAGQGGWP
jgi:hypothetical protein